LAALPEVRAAVASGACIAGFMAVLAEIDPAEMLDQARAGGAKIALPRVPPRRPAQGDEQDDAQRSDSDRGPRLRFHLASASDLRPGRFGIQEPDASFPGVPAQDVAVMIVPGLAFDESGQRLGSGGGYYDEVLMGHGSTRPRLVVGLGYDFQVVDACPAGPEDARVDCVVTDGRVIRCTEIDPGGRSDRRGGGAGA
jgi:5-formyltetrahydrofolate cyclo-ligase